MPRELVVTLRMKLETDEGDSPTDQQMDWAAGDAISAIRNRLMGSGFLPCNILIDEYSISSKMEEPKDA